MGDPLGATARGTLGGTPVVNGAAQIGASLNIDGCTVSVTNWLKAGDYIQLGAASTATLHKILQDVNTNASGQATLDIWPSMRTAPTAGATVIISNAVGRFRLNSGQQDWSINNISSYGITFAAVEAIT
jgi:precorrin-3B methylase